MTGPLSSPPPRYALVLRGIYFCGLAMQGTGNRGGADVRVFCSGDVGRCMAFCTSKAARATVRALAYHGHTGWTVVELY
jgi:hypothetical protein